MENNDEQAKQQQQVPKQLSLDQLEQVDSDHAFALALQEQESTFTMLETIESDTDEDGQDDEDEEEDEEIGSSSSQDFDENFDSQEFYDELESLEDDEEGSYTDQIEEDEIDPDEMSYEELMALGEIVGEESRGLSIEEINSSISPYNHKFVQSKIIIDRCVICQIEYEEGEQLVALNCQHPFHTDCINQWLQIKKDIRQISFSAIRIHTPQLCTRKNYKS
ncbi:E3 ubiquitin ligase BIG BROTHER-related [Beta vulgaris subsp. vulgaris]|uniref:E3 ubiquitin ligase BIG BROTHER-related n=1 Tax=Beta vulgaris subsp. vulgaris TaxID=3555 RepID=UPI002036FC9F|nr:E3 ubiquitin ligase BIG BROTHER-related [Beta vulgaris subsp. vulgaris]